MLTTEREMEDFLSEYKKSRVIVESTVRALLNQVLEFENKLQKPFYNFTSDEILELYKSKNTISDRALQNANLTLKHATRWMADKKNLNIENPYDGITRKLLLGCVNVQRRKNMIFSAKDIMEMQEDLLNWTDKGILQMLFLGAGANWLKELTFFDMSQVSRKDGLVYFKTGKIIPITERDYMLIKNACDEEDLISFGETSRISRVRSHGFFKQRFNALSSSDDPTNEQDLERRFRFIQRRLRLISKDVGVQLTSSGIQTGGLLHHIQQGVRESGMTFREYVKTKEAKQLARRYDITTELCGQILVDKFEEYFL